jgi:hypothetical protein
MRTSRVAILSIFLFVTKLASAQVVSPIEISDPEIRALQQRSIDDLKLVGASITGHHFDFPFYFSRKLDIDERQQKRTDQHSIRFERYNGATVLAISGNYYGAYSSDRFNGEQRAKETFVQVVMPILKAVVPAFQGNATVQGYAIEVSHHVIGKTMGMPIERAENLMVYFPRSAAIKLVAAQTNLAQQAALLDADIFLNATQMSLWLTDGDRTDATEDTVAAIKSADAGKASQETGAARESVMTASVAKENSAPQTQVATTALPSVKPGSAAFLTPSPALVPAQPLPPPVRDLSPQAIATLQSSIQGASNHMLKKLEPAAHFVSYAPPAFVPFHHQVYLELSLTTALTESPEASRYKLAALAFDQHISPLIRRVLGYFPGEQSFDGISFSTTVRGRTRPGAPAVTPLSVEFFFPMEALRRYESYDCTGQQLIDSGIVLINGERAGLDLQLAQGGGQH